jgi:conjugal transfer pilus assembly protein TraB
MTGLPEAESPDDLYDPNEGARRRQRSLWLAVAVALGLCGLFYVWSLLSPSPHRTVDETKKRVLATAELARNPEPPEVVNGDLKRQVQQLEQQNADLQSQNLQLADAAKQAEGGRATDRTDAMRTIAALEDEVNRKRGDAVAGQVSTAPSGPGASPARSPLAGAAPAPSLAPVPVLVGKRPGEGSPADPEAVAAPPPRRVINVIRANAPGPRPDALGPDAAVGAAAPTEFANRAPPGAPTSSGPSGAARAAKTNAAYFTSKLETYATADFVPPNAYAAAEVLVGVDSATSVNSAADPKPVLLRLTGDAVSVGADGRHQHTDLRGCLVNGAAYGELSSEKVYVKLQRITCPADDKSFSVATVEGYVSQKGKAGVRGVVVERAGGLTARAAVAGTLQGLGTTLSQNLSRSAGGVNAVAGPGGILGSEKLSPSELAQGALGGGVSNAASQLAEYYIKRAEQYQPVIEMPTGIEVEIVFLSGFQIRSGA